MHTYVDQIKPEHHVQAHPPVSKPWTAPSTGTKGDAEWSSETCFRRAVPVPVSYRTAASSFNLSVSCTSRLTHGALHATDSSLPTRQIEWLHALVKLQTEYVPLLRVVSCAQRDAGENSDPAMPLDCKILPNSTGHDHRVKQGKGTALQEGVARHPHFFLVKLEAPRRGKMKGMYPTVRKADVPSNTLGTLDRMGYMWCTERMKREIVARERYPARLTSTSGVVRSKMKQIRVMKLPSKASVLSGGRPGLFRTSRARDKGSVRVELDAEHEDVCEERLVQRSTVLLLVEIYVSVQSLGANRLSVLMPPPLPVQHHRNPQQHSFDGSLCHVARVKSEHGATQEDVRFSQPQLGRAPVLLLPERPQTA